MAGLRPLSPPSIDAAPVGGASSGASSGASGQAAESAAAQWLDRADIRLLDVPAALQILLFEVSDALGLAPPAAPLQSADHAAALIVDAFLQRVPVADPIEPADSAGLAWIGAADQIQTALEGGLDRAQSIVAAWRGVTAEVIASIAASRAIVAAALVDEPAPKFLLRPEWLGLAPRIERYRRRRRAVRRRLQDPDYRTPR